MRGYLIAMLLWAAGPARGQLANQPPVPEWLGGGASVETRFEQKDPLLMAILLVAAGDEVSVIVNGEAAGTADDPAKASSLDITRFLRQGENTLQLRAAKGPVRVAALLELNGDLAVKRWIRTDGTWTTPDGPAAVGGPTDADPAANPFDLTKTFDAYNSWQLAKPGQQNQATDAATLTVPPGFKADLIRSAGPDEDSWVAMAFDPEGRITLAKEKRGLLRVDRTGTAQVIEDTLLECRGLVYAEGALFANANNSKGLYRLRDADGDGRFEEKSELLHTEGSVGHGRNHLKRGPDGHLWIAHGNNVLLPSPLAERPALRHFGPDQVLPNPWDGTMFDGDVELPAGHILRMSPAGGPAELVAGGLRNPLDIAFNRDGELFTFDADMERDVGASWYMPTRILHLVPGADYGWRRGTGRFPSWYVDTLPSVVDIGLSSPTGIFFGYGAKFPPRYEQSLFILDWSYGRIIAVQLTPDGASYRGRQEPFISGRPLNVTDGCIGPDGALWFITGGRGTQSGLYRVTYAGAPSEAIAIATSPDPAAAAGRDLRALRRRLEAVRSDGSAEDRSASLALIQPNLEHPDRFIRFAARVALERLPPDLWKDEIIGNATGWRAILGCLALARVGDGSAQPRILASLEALPWTGLDAEQQLATLRTLGVALARLGPPGGAARERILTWLDPLYPAPGFPMNQELCRLLIALKSPVVLTKSLALLREATTSEELVFYPMHLRYLGNGWDIEARRGVFEALNRAEKLNGASTYFKVIQDTRSELAAALTPPEAQSLASIIHPLKPVALSPHALPGHSFKAWKLEDLAPRLDEVGKGRSFANGRAAAITSQCVFCHKMSPDPALPGGLVGPELVQVSARFNRRDLLDHILNPSKVIDEKFRFLTVTRTDGTQVTGSLESEDDERVKLKPNPLAADTVEIGKSMIRERVVSAVSPMPPGLLNPLRAGQILDLLAFIEAGGDPTHRDFQP